MLKKSLRQKLAFSYGLLILMILLVSLWGVYNFIKLGQAVDTILINNYKSILAAENMKEALEREDSAAMFFVANQVDKARQQFGANSQRFTAEFQIAAANITEPGEDQIIADIKAQYEIYKNELNSFISQPESKTTDEKAAIYFNKFEPAFNSLKKRLDDLLHLNQRAMVAANDRAFAQSWRAEVSTGVLAITSLLLALLFSWRFTSYLVNPITKMTETAKQIAEGDFEQHIDINSEDEIGILASEFNRMASRLRDMKKTNRWRMLMEQKKSDAVINSIYEPVIVTDSQGRLIKLNQAATALFHQPDHNNGNGDVEDLSLSGFGAGEQILRTVKDAVAMQKPVAAEGEAAIVPVKVGGAEKSFRLRTTPMRDSEGRLIGAVSVLEDITSIREVDRVKTEFISIASNKMRTPLQSLQMALYSLVNGYAGELDDKQLDLAYSAHQDAEKLDELIDDLLELAEIESGAKTLNKESLRPIELVRTILEQYSPYAENKHIKLEQNIATDCSRVKADKKAVKRIFDNLLSNAIRHTPKNGNITMSAQERGDRVIFSVSDTGEGIPEECLPNIFGRFVHIKGSPEGGTGLGLALVKRLVEEQGGQVGVESKVGDGTTFTFTLPIANLMDK